MSACDICELLTNTQRTLEGLPTLSWKGLPGLKSLPFSLMLML